MEQTKECQRLSAFFLHDLKTLKSLEDPTQPIVAVDLQLLNNDKTTIRKWL